MIEKLEIEKHLNSFHVKEIDSGKHVFTCFEEKDAKEIVERLNPTTKKQPFCWKCNSAITTLTKSNAFELTGCTECSDIKDYADAEKLCPLLLNPNKVILTVIDGEVSLLEKPDNILVEVRDYVDTDDIADAYEQDERGDTYRVFSFPAEEIDLGSEQTIVKLDPMLVKPLKSALKNITILQHNVSYYLDENELLTIEVGDCEYEHIHYMITEGYIEGELNKTDPKDDEKTIIGWWKIVK